MRKHVFLSKPINYENRSNGAICAGEEEAKNWGGVKIDADVDNFTHM